MSSWVLDALVGWSFCLFGLATWRRRHPATGVLMVATGVLWFVGGLAGPAVFAHRGPLVQLVVGYPQGRLRDRAKKAVVTVGYLDALVYPVGRSSAATVALAGLVVGVVVRDFRRSSGAERRARLTAVVVATPVFGLLGFAGGARLTGRHIDQGLLAAYEVVVIAVAVIVFADSRWARWDLAVINTLAVDLGHDESSSSLRDRLATALGDPTLVLGYVMAGREELVDEAGKPVPIATGSPGRVVTPIFDSGSPIAVLVHDSGVLDDPALLGSVTALTKLALVNMRLHDEVRDRAAEVEASRRRLVSVADAERARLAAEVRSGPEHRLERVAQLLTECSDRATGLMSQLAACRTEINDFARGIHPPALTDLGLRPAISEIVSSAPVPFEISIPGSRFARDVEAAAYFLCAEAVANIAKYAQATQARIEITPLPDELTVEISDDGLGGADPTAGSGLIGLTDRLDVLGGTLTVDSPPRRGTRLTARIPLTGNGVNR